MMKVTFERSGSFAGIVRTAKIDPELLPTDQGDHLCQLMQATDFFHLSTTIAPTNNSQPDRFQYKIIAEDAN